jgi:hypothetical protein
MVYAIQTLSTVQTAPTITPQSRNATTVCQAVIFALAQTGAYPATTLCRFLKIDHVIPFTPLPMCLAMEPVSTIITPASAKLACLIA